MHSAIADYTRNFTSLAFFLLRLPSQITHGTLQFQHRFYEFCHRGSHKEPDFSGVFSVNASMANFTRSRTTFTFVPMSIAIADRTGDLIFSGVFPMNAFIANSHGTSQLQHIFHEFRHRGLHTELDFSGALSIKVSISNTQHLTTSTPSSRIPPSRIA